MRFYQAILTTFLLLPSVAMAEKVEAKSARSAEAVPARTAGEVKAIVDGDTIRLKIDGLTESVRLIGIDTPESRENKKAKRDAERSGEDLKTILAEGKKATEYLKTILPKGSVVKLESDVQGRDRYGRRLSYVFLKDGTMLNEKIIRDGYANLMTYPPNVKYVERFRAAVAEARENKRGLWR